MTAISPWEESFRRREARPQAPMLITPRGRVSWGEMLRDVAQTLAWLHRAGLRRGDLILLASRHEREVITLFLAAMRLGLTPMLADPGLRPGELSAQIGRCAARAVAVDHPAPAQLELPPGGLVVPILPLEEKKPSLFDRLLGKKRGPQGGESYPACLHGVEQLTSWPLPRPGDLAYVLSTSGSTAAPKGVMLTHAAVAAHARTQVNHLLYSDTSRVLNPLPLHHADGVFQSILIPLATGACVIRPGRFTVGGLVPLLDVVHSEGATHLIAVPTLLALIERLAREEARELGRSGLQVLISTAGHLDEALWRRCEALFGVPITNFYGLSETVSGALFCGARPETRKVGTLGKPADCAIRIVDGAGVDAPPGASGELLIQGEHLMSGYLGDPEQTAQVLREGWLWTGDRVHLDEGGFVVMEGRIKNMIIRGGANVQPLEIMAVLSSLEGVEASFVFGEDDEIWGQRVVACVVADPARWSPAGLAEASRAHLAPEKVPDQFHVVSALPYGPSGKVNQPALRQLLGGGQAGAAQRGPELWGDVLRAASAAFRVPEGSLTRASSPENTAGWDSLAHMALVASLERTFQLRFSSRDILRMKCLADVEQRVAEQLGGARG